ncbi:DUF6291 domain-containing protein [Oscillospiraceae bacterium WX1]
MAQDKKGFVLYYSYREPLALLSDEDRGRLLMALLDYGEFGKVAHLGSSAEMAFSFIKAQMDRDATKWEETRQAKVRAGQQGGIKSGQSRRASAEEAKQNEADESLASFASECKAMQANEA